jgi:triosephosphate isomerase
VYPKDSGAFTGEVSPLMLKEFVSYVLVGHSERRTLLYESDGFINEKLHALLATGLKPILCIGETLSERKEGRAFDVIARELEAGLKDVTNEQLSRVTIAYEPIWAIGTGETATPEIAEEMHVFMHDWLAKRFGTSSVGKVRLLYGGSLKADNAKQLLSQPHIDGGLIGGASLKADSFVEIARIADGIEKDI